MTSKALLERFPALSRLSWRRTRGRVPVVRQLAASDCGAAALCAVLAYHGRFVALEDVRQSLGVGRDGTSGTALLRVARLHGLRARAVRLEAEDVRDLPTGSVLYWGFRHFVVFERHRDDRVDLVDPAVGRRCVTSQEFRRVFTGVAFIFEPGEAFERAGVKPQKVRGLFRQLLAERDLLGRIVSTSLLVQILSAAMPLITGILIDRVVPRRDYSLLMALALGYCLFQAFNVLAGWVRAHLLIHLRTRMDVRLSVRFIDHLVKLPYSFFQQHTSGDVLVRLGSNNAVKDILTSTALSAFVDGTMAITYVGILLLTSVPLTLLVLVLAAARVSLMVVTRTKQRLVLSELVQNEAEAQTLEVEMLAGMETLKAMGLEHAAAERWSNVFVDGLNLSMRRGWIDATFNALLGAFGLATTLALMFYGAFLVLQGQLTLGTMMAFSALAAGVLGPLDSLVATGLQVQMLEVYLDRMNEVLDSPPEQRDDEVRPCGTLSGAITLDAVSFRYPGQERLVIRNASVTIEPGSRVALVGRTGSAKSTLARLIAGLYEPVSGRILFDGQDLRNIDRQSVRVQLGIMTQDTQLFGGSIRRNIALSDPEMSLERIRRAAEIAVIHDDIQAMPMGYNTVLADRGLSLSGGQRQRLAIARAIVRQPRILILDEATSHLDSATEQEVSENLATLGCTCVVIAHRLGTIRNADLILVLDNGTIVEQGRHDDLVSRRGAYAALLGSYMRDLSGAVASSSRHPETGAPAARRAPDDRRVHPRGAER